MSVVGRGTTTATSATTTAATTGVRAGSPPMKRAFPSSLVFDASFFLTLLSSPPARAVVARRATKRHRRVEVAARVLSASQSPRAASSLADHPFSARLSEEQREMRTVFVSQLAVRVTDRELGIFFENFAGKVRDARVIVDKITRRSKGCADFHSIHVL